MKRFFVKTNGYNAVIFVDKNSNGYVIDETAFDEPLTLNAAKNADYSNFDGCETAEDCAASIGIGNNIITFNPTEYDNITEF